jgi:hypothetical protein
MRRWQRLVLVSLVLCGAGSAMGAEGEPPATPEGFGINQAIRDGEARRAAVAPPAQGPLLPRAENAALPVYTGTLGGKPVLLRIGPKPDERDSFRGEYALGGMPGVRLVAGEYEGGAFLMEESDDGTRVSGNWEGTIDSAGAVRGTWTDPYQPGLTLPFELRPLGKRVIPPASPDAADPAGAAHDVPPTPPSSPNGH